MRTITYLAVIGIWVGMAAADCQETKPNPKPQHSTLCGTGPDGLIYCEVPAESGEPK
jgi:hypothetical protein